MTQRLLTRWFLISKERGNQSTGLLTGSGEVDMAVGFGSVFALGFGVVLAALVAAAARFGAPAELILAARRTNPVAVIGATGTVKRVFDLLDALQRQGLRRYQAVSYTPRRPLMRVPLAV